MPSRIVKFTTVAALISGLSVASAPASAQSSDAFEKGVAAFEVGKYKEAIALWEPAAEQGNVDALVNMAQLYRLGLGVDQDDAKAYELYEKAANKGSDDAQVNVAFQLLMGRGVDQDREAAAGWFAKASDRGNALAQYNLGVAAAEKAASDEASAAAQEAAEIEEKERKRAEAEKAKAEKKKEAKRPLLSIKPIDGKSKADKDDRPVVNVVRTPTRKPGDRVAG